jgi:hypothetical protein
MPPSSHQNAKLSDKDLSKYCNKDISQAGYKFMESKYLLSKMNTPVDKLKREVEVYARGTYNPGSGYKQLCKFNLFMSGVNRKANELRQLENPNSTLLKRDLRIDINPSKDANGIPRLFRIK